jgi:hypothetical protein
MDEVRNGVRACLTERVNGEGLARKRRAQRPGSVASSARSMNLDE